MKRVKFIFLTALLLLFTGALKFSVSRLWAESTSSWQEEKADHFIIYYQSNQNFARQAARKSEVFYNRIANDLGYPRYSNFWQWDKRVKIFFYPNKETFSKATGQPEWSHGMASYLDKEIHAIENEDFLESALPHEIAHLIFRDFVGIGQQIPLWIDEGVAQWAEPAKREIAKEVAKRLLIAGAAQPLKELVVMDIRQSQDGEQVTLFYQQSVCLIDFLIKQYGQTRFTQFCRDLRDGKSVEEALRSTYQGSLPTIDELEKKWRKYVLES